MTNRQASHVDREFLRKLHIAEPADRPADIFASWKDAEILDLKAQLREWHQKEIQFASERYDLLDSRQRWRLFAFALAVVALMCVASNAALIHDMGLLK